MIDYIAYDVLSGKPYWARVVIKRSDQFNTYDVRRQSAQRLTWMIIEMVRAGIGYTQISALGWYWRRT